MPRCGRIRRFIREYSESSFTDKISCIPPFLILTIEIILLRHAFVINEPYIIILTTALLIISLLEIIFVTLEIHHHYQRSSFDRNLTIRLDDFILERKMLNVKSIVEKFIERYPDYEKFRNEIYRIACQILRTHREELWEKTLRSRLEKFIDKNDYDNIKDIVEGFVEKYPEYLKNPGKVYSITAKIMEKSNSE